jgi:hypothetical protein
MKDFAGVSRFQAPVPEDFQRGMQAPAHALKCNKQPTASAHGALASVILGFKAFYTGQDVEGKPADDSHAPG